MSFCNLSAKILPNPRNKPQRRRRLKTQHTLIPNPPKPPDESLPIRMFSLVFVNVNGIWCKSPTPSLSWICNAFSRCPSRVRNFPKSIPAKFPFPISKAVRINCPSNPISLSPHKSRSQPVLGFPEQAHESFSYLKDAIYIYPKMSGGGLRENYWKGWRLLSKESRRNFWCLGGQVKEVLRRQIDEGQREQAYDVLG